MKLSFILMVFIVFVYLIPSEIIGFSFPYNKKYYRTSSKHFTIIFNKENKLKAYKILDIAESVHNRLYKKFDIDDSIHTYILLLDNTAIANGMASILPSNVIVLYNASPLLSIEKSLLNFYNWTDELVIHEYTHILHLNQANDILYGLKKIGIKFAGFNSLLPISSIEGLAVGIESYETPMGRAKSSYSSVIIRTAVYENKVPSIDEISTFANKIPEGVGPYIWGGAFHYYLINKFKLNKITDIYNKNSSCFTPFTAMLTDSKIDNCAISCVSCFPLNSIFANNNKYNTGYYTEYNHWILKLKKQYKQEISKLKNLSHIKDLGLSDNFAQIYNIKMYNNTIYFSAKSYDYGFGLFRYNVKNKKFDSVISDRLITDFTIKNNFIYFLDYNINDNVYDYFYLYKYNLKTDKIKKVCINDRVISFDLRDNKIYYLTKKNNSYELISFDLIYSKKKKKKKILKLKNYELADNIQILGESIFFIGKKENDFVDIYNINIEDKKIDRITHNSGIEFSLKVYDNKVYFISDYNKIFNIYCIENNSIFRLSNIITGISEFEINNNNFYISYFTSNGYKLKKIKNTYKEPFINQTVTNFLYTDKKTNIINVPKTSINDFSYFKNLFSNLIYFPLISREFDYFTFGAYIYFSDIMLKNSLTSIIDIADNMNYFNIDMLYKNNFNRFSYSFYFNISSYSYISAPQNIYMFGGRLNYFFYKLYKNFNGYLGYEYNNIFDVKFNYFYCGFAFNNEKRYMYSITAEKGWDLNIKYMFYPEDNLNAITYSVVKNINTYFKHTVLKLKAYGGNIISDTQIRFYGIGKSSTMELNKADFVLSLNSTENTLYFVNNNYLYFIGEYHFPIIWIERGILNMPLFLRNININLYSNNFGGYEDIKKLKFVNIVGAESNFNFYFYYRIEGNFTVGIKSNADNFNNYTIYLNLTGRI